MTNEVFFVRGLQKSFGGRQVLSADSFFAMAGECALVVGGNGCGKTTLLKILAGLLSPDSISEFYFGGQKCNAPPSGENGAVMLHQTPFMFSASARANVAIAAKEESRIVESLQWARLSDNAMKNARELSGGERARISLARARAAKMKLCLLDEPAAHLDADGLKLVADLIEDLKHRGAAVVVAMPAPTNAILFDREWRLDEGGRLTAND